MSAAPAIETDGLTKFYGRERGIEDLRAGRFRGAGVLLNRV